MSEVSQQELTQDAEHSLKYSALCQLTLAESKRYIPGKFDLSRVKLTQTMTVQLKLGQFHPNCVSLTHASAPLSSLEDFRVHVVPLLNSTYLPKYLN